MLLIITKSEQAKSFFCFPFCPYRPKDGKLDYNIGFQDNKNKLEPFSIYSF